MIDAGESTWWTMVAKELPTLIHDRNTVFVIDCSNAMAGEPLLAAKAACRRLIGSLGDHQHFNLVAYGSGALMFDESLHRASPRTQFLAGDFLELLEVMGEKALRHALNRALGSAGNEPCNVVVLAGGAEGDLEAAIRKAGDLAAKVHCLDCSGREASPLRGLAEMTGGIHLPLPRPANASPIPEKSLPRRYGCVDTAFIRLEREPVPCSPDGLMQALASRQPFSWLDDNAGASLQAWLREMGYPPMSEAAAVASCERVLEDLRHMGGLSWMRHRMAGDVIDGPIYLKLRVRSMQRCRQWCRQEVVFNPSYDPADLPPFLLRDSELQRPSVPPQSVPLSRAD